MPWRHREIGVLRLRVTRVRNRRPMASSCSSSATPPAPICRPLRRGSHLAIRVPSGAMRNYSLCNDPHERDRYVVAVKREEQGRGGSVSLVDGVRAGDTVQVAPPQQPVRW